jgi:NAD(P)-dependent dehydrogenase (short-subunit alcohol dehydrogenase family)
VADLRDRRVAVIGASTSLGRALAAALEAAGARLAAAPCELVVDAAGLEDAELRSLVEAGGAILLGGGDELAARVRRLATALAADRVRVNGVALSEQPGPLGRPSPADAAEVALTLMRSETMSGVTVALGAGRSAEPVAEPSRGDAELDIAGAVAWIDARLAKAPGGMPVHELTDDIVRGDAGFDPLAAGFPTPLLFVRYALARGLWALDGEDERTARIVPVSPAAAP